ncbi:alpha/beta hydrolase-fold protein [Maribacter sp. PR1]|uniref:Alpha/beta hydrolase-fold protein n=1 Tax=Maribacter cobaltidurans TaxID=1178778 RepID=A0ABU7IVF0_9FLAO|nr:MULTISPECIES: esterase [Maribacter]MDC6389114.1 alpha/beta hydrolase-fold protein [Maribacter sp. PR1]MEE1976501.1 alpha/beta hydrolase-fold protein [Maribacter cobaltidurans]
MYEPNKEKTMLLSHLSFTKKVALWQKTAALLLLMTLTAMAQEVGQRERLVSPELKDDNTVVFSIRAPKAENVTLSGNWMPMVPDGIQGMKRQTVALTKDGQGVWSTTVGPLEPELYGYSFLVDGVTTLDPSNLKVARDGTFRTESLLYVPGDASDLYWAKTGPKGSVHQIWYESPTLDLTRRMFVYTPPGYHESKENYPVLYLLHGGGGDEEAWPTLGVAPTILDNLINSGKAKPMIVVMTNGNPSQASAQTISPKLPNVEQSAGGMANMMFEKSLVNDVIPYIERNFKVKANKENRALTGLSMGGLQTINTSFENPNLFDYIGVMSMGFADLSRFGIEVDHSKRAQQILALKAAGPDLYWIACGKDDFLYESVVTMRNELDKQDFDYTYRESTGGHTWSNWRIYLSEFAPMLFK